MLFENTFENGEIGTCICYIYFTTIKKNKMSVKIEKRFFL